MIVIFNQLTTEWSHNLESMAEEFLDNWHDMYPADVHRDIRKKIEEKILQVDR